MTPHRSIVNERVPQAKELIAKGRLLVDIAAKLGFASQSHFTGVFRKVTGMSPGSPGDSGLEERDFTLGGFAALC